MGIETNNPVFNETCFTIIFVCFSPETLVGNSGFNRKKRNHMQLYNLFALKNELLFSDPGD